MYLIPPLEGINTTPGIYLTQKFGENLQDYSQFGMKGHNGLDWAAPKGTPIKAVHDGDVVMQPAQSPGYGNEVRLYFEEDGTVWDCVCAHLDRFEGTSRKVKAGDIVGYVDSTGFSTGHHLHFGLRKLLNGTVLDYNNGYLGYINPAPFFERMNQAKIVKSKKSATVYICYPVPDLEYLEKTASLQGISLPSPFPDTDSL